MNMKVLNLESTEIVGTPFYNFWNRFGLELILTIIKRRYGLETH